MTERQYVLPEEAKGLLTSSLIALKRRNGELERQLRQQRDASSGEQETLFLELLEVIDMLENLAEALGHAPDPTAAAMKRLNRAIGATAAKLKGTLEKRSVLEIPEPGQGLDFALHKVVEREVRPELPEHTPIKVLKRGYTVAGRVLRPTEVITSRQA